MTARPPSCPCGCHGAIHTLLSPVKAENIYTPSAETAALVHPSTSHTDPHDVTLLDKNLELRVRRLVRELADVKTRLARAETNVVEVRATLETERQLQAAPTTSTPEQPLHLPLLDDSDNSKSDSSSSETTSECEWETQIVPRRPHAAACAKTIDGQGTTKALKKPIRIDGRGRRRAVCSVDGCHSLSQLGGLCYRHSGVSRPRCTEPGCENTAMKIAKCKRHGGNPVCNVRGCAQPAYKKWQCTHHGGYRLCRKPTCFKAAFSHGHCRLHGGTAQCAVDWCTKLARRAGNCLRHDREGDVV